ncbi:MAG: heme exporter protein CcmD [Comamonadaceae bacterium]|nr:MAG: heme exporter protein CcmD [Comamonadaceae bacterium]
MNWNSLQDFLAMSGYGRYVWSAFGITALVLALETAQLAFHRRRLAQGDRDEG